MKRLKRTLIMIVLLGVRAMASELTGTWSGTFKVSGGDHSTPQIISLKQDGKKLTGSAGPEPAEQYPIENGKIDGNRITFEVTSGEWRFSYDLKWSGQDDLKGSLDLTSVNDKRTAVVSLSRTK